MARPPNGPDMVDGTEGSPDAKARLKVILETIAGTKTIAEACGVLGMCEAAFFKLRTRVVQEAVEGLEPRKPGRKPRETSVDEAKIRGLESEVEKLRRALRAAELREQLGLTMPHLMGDGKKNENDRR